MDQNKVQKKPQFVYKHVFKCNCAKSFNDCKKVLDKITIPLLTSKKANICEADLVEKNRLNH